MGFVDFLSALFEDGHLAVPEVQPISADTLSAGDDLLCKYEQVQRLNMPGEAPEFILPAARWAAIQLFRACQFAVYRDLDESVLRKHLGVSFNEPITPAVHYSVDLTFQYLPDVLRFAKSAAEGDPLVKQLIDWAKMWPLSSVGIAGLKDISVDGFIGEISLRQFYVDRILARGDESRFSDPRVRDAIQATLGMYPELNERAQSALKKYEVQESL